MLPRYKASSRVLTRRNALELTAQIFLNSLGNNNWILLKKKKKSLNIPSHRFSRSVRSYCIAAKRSCCNRLIDARFPMLRESISNGYSRIGGNLLRLFRWLPVGSCTCFLFGWFKVTEENWIQRKRLANIRRRMESEFQQLQWNHSHRVGKKPNYEFYFIVTLRNTRNSIILLFLFFHSYCRLYGNLYIHIYNPSPFFPFLLSAISPFFRSLSTTFKVNTSVTGQVPVVG